MVEKLLVSLLGVLKGIGIYLNLPRSKRATLKDILLSQVGLHGIPFTFSEDGLCTIHNSDFCKNTRFKQAYECGFKTNSWRGWHLRWRAYLYCCFAEQSTACEGDFVECGVNLGGNARMLVEYLNFIELKKRMFLFDTFCGFDTAQLTKRERALVKGRYDYRSSFDSVKTTFQDFHFVHLIEGSVPQSLKKVSINEICFLSIDLNCARPEVAALSYFWPKLSNGAVVLLDDYGFKHHEEQKVALDRLSLKLGFQIIQLPTGQGLIIKRIKLLK